MSSKLRALAETFQNVPGEVSARPQLDTGALL
jgi:hypothetical protein